MCSSKALAQAIAGDNKGALESCNKVFQLKEDDPHVKEDSPHVKEDDPHVKEEHEPRASRSIAGNSRGE